MGRLWPFGSGYCDANVTTLDKKNISLSCDTAPGTISNAHCDYFFALHETPPFCNGTLVYILPTPVPCAGATATVPFTIDCDANKATFTIIDSIKPEGELLRNGSAQNMIPFGSGYCSANISQDLKSVTVSCDTAPGSGANAHCDYALVLSEPTTSATTSDTGSSTTSSTTSSSDTTTSSSDTTTSSSDTSPTTTTTTTATPTNTTTTTTTPTSSSVTTETTKNFASRLFGIVGVFTILLVLTI